MSSEPRLTDDRSGRDATGGKDLPWPQLPQAVRNGVAGQTDGQVLVGLGSAGHSLYALDLAAPARGWVARAAFPGPARDGAAAAVAGGRLYVVSGLGKATDLDPAPSVLQDVHAFDPAANRWDRLATEAPIGLLGATALALDEDRIAFVGGVNKQLFDSFISASLTADKHPETRWQLVETYMSMAPEAYRWNGRVLVYTISANQWSDLGANPWLPNCGAALAVEADGFLLINGEIKPGLRTPQVKHIGLQGDQLVWTEQAPIPPLAGHALQDGLAGAHAGHSNGVLLVAGGTSFHGSRIRAAAGESFAHRGLPKVWNREIYARLDGVWRVAGQLPTGLAHGASFTTPRGLVIAGGEDAAQTARADVYLLAWDGTRVRVTCGAAPTAPDTRQSPDPKGAP